MKKNLVSIKAYAKLKGCTHQNIYYLVNKGLIQTETVTIEQKRIDLNKYPVEK